MLLLLLAIGAFTGGIAFEGLNNAGKIDANLIIVLNDNGMSISRIKVHLPCILHTYVLQESI